MKLQEDKKKGAQKRDVICMNKEDELIKILANTESEKVRLYAAKQELW